MVGTVSGSSVDGVGLTIVIIILKRSRGNPASFLCIKRSKDGLLFTLLCLVVFGTATEME